MIGLVFFFFFNDTATTEIYTLSLHDALPILVEAEERFRRLGLTNIETRLGDGAAGWPEEAPFNGIIVTAAAPRIPEPRSEEHTSELQSQSNLVCRLLLEKKKKH